MPLKLNVVLSKLGQPHSVRSTAHPAIWKSTERSCSNALEAFHHEYDRLLRLALHAVQDSWASTRNNPQWRCRGTTQTRPRPGRRNGQGEGPSARPPAAPASQIKRSSYLPKSAGHGNAPPGDVCRPHYIKPLADFDPRAAASSPCSKHQGGTIELMRVDAAAVIGSTAANRLEGHQEIKAQLKSKRIAPKYRIRHGWNLPTDQLNLPWSNALVTARTDRSHYSIRFP